MGDFGQHFRAGLFTAAIATVITLSYGVGRGLSVSWLVITASGVFLSLLVGSVIPDIDVHSSIPRRYFGQVLLFAGVGVAGLFAIGNPTLAQSLGRQTAALVGLDSTGGTVSVEFIGGGLLLVSGLVAAKLIGYGIDTITTHRGFVHSIGFAVLYGAAVFAAATQIPPVELLAAGIIGGAGTAGVLVHTRVVDR